MKLVEHIAYNPMLDSQVPIDRIPEGYELTNIVPATDYEWIMVCQRIGADTH